MLNLEKLLELQELSRIPGNDGEQFIDVMLRLGSGKSGEIHFGFKHKLDMGSYEFSSLDEAIELVTKLRQQASPES